MVSALVSDTGRYVCVAENVAGSAEKLFNLNVHGKSLKDPLYCFLLGVTIHFYTDTIHVSLLLPIRFIVDIGYEQSDSPT